MRVSVQLFASAAILAFLAPADGHAAQSPNVTGSCSVRNVNAPTLEHLILSPTSGVPVPAYPREEPEHFAPANAGKALGYTRIRASFVPCTGYDRSYPQERRSGIKRFFFGKNADKLLKLDVFLKPGDAKFEAPLSNLTRHSTKQGENWGTSVHNDRILTPYFRADLGSQVTLEASVKSTRDYDATVGTDVMDLISQASALIAPTAPLLTDENKGRFNAAAGFVDKAVDGLLKVAIDEKALTDIQLYPGKDGLVLAVLTVSLPMANNTFPNTTFPNQPLGQWIVYAEGLRQSMLGTVVNGRVDRLTTSPATVLNYEVGDKKTLREALSGIKSITSARDGLVSASVAEAENKARPLCRAIAAEAEQLKLAPADVGAAAWAYLTELAFPTDKMKNAEKGCSEVERYPS